MKGRGLVGGLALLLALLATVLVFVYVKNVKDDAESGSGTVSVVVAKEDIPVGTQLDSLISDGAFETTAIPEEAVVRGAVTDLGDLEGLTTSAPILAGEQISTARLSGTGEQVAGGQLGIPKKHVAVTASLESQRIVGGDLQRGDHVVIFATFSGAAPEEGGGATAGSGGAASAVTVTLVPDAEMLKVLNTVTEGVTGSAPGSGNSSATFALTQQEAQEFVFAQENGTVWLGLLPPGEKGKKIPPTTVFKVVR